MTPAKRQTIKQILKRYPVTVAYLFGSQARGDTGPLSDTDIAVLFADSVKPDQMFDLKLKMLSELTATLQTDKVDFVPLQQASSNLAMKILSEGQLLFSKNETARVVFEAQTMNHYLDRDYYEKRYNRLMHQQIIQGKP